MVTVGPHQGQGALDGLIHPFLDFHHMVNNSVRCAAKAAEKAVERVNKAALEYTQPLAAEDASSAAATLPAAPVAADARGESPHANDDDSQVELICSGSRKVGPTRRRHPGHPSL